MTRYAFFTLPLLLLGVSCTDDRNIARKALGPSLSVTAELHGANSTICLAYSRQLAVANVQLADHAGNAALQHRVNVLNNVIRDSCR